MTISIIDFIRFRVQFCSDKIFQIKKDALESRTAYRYGYVDKKTGERATVQSDSNDTVWDRYPYTTFDSHICPTHPKWNEYKGLKRQVSLWIAALHVAKDNEHTEKYHNVSLKDARQQFKHAMGQFKDMVPSQKSALTKWVEEREKERENAKKNVSACA